MKRSTTDEDQETAGLLADELFKRTKADFFIEKMAHLPEDVLSAAVDAAYDAGSN